MVPRQVEDLNLWELVGYDREKKLPLKSDIGDCSNEIYGFCVQMNGMCVVILLKNGMILILDDIVNV